MNCKPDSRNLRALPLLAAVLVMLALIFAACSGSGGGTRIGTIGGGVSPVVPVSGPGAAANASTVPATAQRPADPGSGPEAQLATLLAAFDIQREFAVLAELASDAYGGRKTGSAGAERAASYIESQLAAQGLTPWSAIGLTTLRQSFSVRGQTTENVLGVLPGSGGPAAGYVILAAHYDHLGIDAAGQVFNGADDNAAGVAAVIEALSMIRQTDLTPIRNLVFCAFSGEEQGQYGASALGELIAGAGLADQVEMYNIDGIGATGGSYLGVWDEGATNAAPLVARLKRSGALLGEAVREEGTDIGSDAQAFDWQFGIPAVTIDWNWGQDESAFHPYYHTVDDDPGAIDQSVLARASRVTIGGFWLSAVS